MADEDLRDVHEDVAALDDHALDGQTLADVLRFADLVVHLARQELELDARRVQTAPLHVLVRRVRQNLVQRDDVARYLCTVNKKKQKKISRGAML